MEEKEKRKKKSKRIRSKKNHKLPFLLPMLSPMLNPITSNSSPSEDPGPKSKLPSSSMIAPGEFWHGYGKEQELGSQNIDAGYNLEEGLRWQLAQRGTYGGECWLFGALIGMMPDGYCFDWS